ncbi:MAG TPA: hypothetical protein VHV82_16445 [Sporichthyaceae bacterium]|jgi:hypothetical protein|nr:hypothetical protein [Sporichthyaceae bacterium]
MIAAALVAGQLATYPSGSYIDDIKQDVVIVRKDHVTVEHGGYGLAHNVHYIRRGNGVIEFKYGGHTYRAALRTDGKMVVTTLGRKTVYVGVYAH